MKITLNVWRQRDASSEGSFETHQLDDVSPDMSFLEMLDVLNRRLEAEGKVPVAFESDCREGICGVCSLMISGQAHGPESGTTTCQLHMRSFKDGDTIFVEPWRAKAFPVIRDLVTDRSSLDRVIQCGGYVSVNTGSVPEANSVQVAKENADKAMDAAACIGCGACVAACPNGSAMLFTAAKLAHLSLLPQGKPEHERRIKRMVEGMDAQGFGACTNHGECQEACPKLISIEFIAKMNRDYIKASLLPEHTSSELLKAQ
ncbi:MAG: succinate dehydrogenase/fumarate reductase iron-sulfur subunit [Deltaproteobacteria bacterium]|nr:succinate dehydrogenase/fumarate reductase iron-sulfur subunit [Deltaproteobacteria bacterium]